MVLGLGCNSWNKQWTQRQEEQGRSSRRIHTWKRRKQDVSSWMHLKQRKNAEELVQKKLLLQLQILNVPMRASPPIQMTWWAPQTIPPLKTLSFFQSLRSPTSLWSPKLSCPPPPRNSTWHPSTGQWRSSFPTSGAGALAGGTVSDTTCPWMTALLRWAAARMVGAITGVFTKLTWGTSSRGTSGSTERLGGGGRGSDVIKWRGVWLGWRPAASSESSIRADLWVVWSRNALCRNGGGIRWALWTGCIQTTSPGASMWAGYKLPAGWDNAISQRGYQTHMAGLQLGEGTTINPWPPGYTMGRWMNQHSQPCKSHMTAGSWHHQFKPSGFLAAGVHLLSSKSLKMPLLYEVNFQPWTVLNCIKKGRRKWTLEVFTVCKSVMKKGPGSHTWVKAKMIC